MRIHTRPARFMWRVRARRAASICRAVTRSGSSALRPYCPKLSSVPAFAFGHLLVLRHGVVLHDLALEDPDLDAAGAVSREGGCDAVIHVGAQGVQRHAALAVPFHARELGAAEPAGAVDADAVPPPRRRR